MILKDLYQPNAEGFIREMRDRAKRIGAQVDIARDGGDFQDTLLAYLSIVTACLAEAEAVHARNMADIEDGQ